jgi:hypothetical protein
MNQLASGDTMQSIDLELARKVLSVVDAGLVQGLGTPEPGKMCVEAAVNYAMGAPHGDQPACVSLSLRRLKIRLNDAYWSSNEARTQGLRRLAIAQLGSAKHLDEKEFARRCAELAIRVSVPAALRAAAGAAKEPHKARLLSMADRCEREPTRANALEATHEGKAAAAAAANAAVYAAANAAAAAAAANAAVYAAANAADAAANAAVYAAAYAAAAAADKPLAAFAEEVVQILIDMKAPGCEWLYLTEEAA